MILRLFIFGEAERGRFHTPISVHTLPQLLDQLGHTPVEGLGILLAIQCLLLERDVLFFRVKEEGFSRDDYMRGLSLLKQEGRELKCSAVCMPGVGDKELIDSSLEICQTLKTPLLLSEKDFYDYLTG